MATPLFIICQSGTREALHMAAMVASVAAVSGRPVTVFVSMNALAHFLRRKSPEAPAAGPAGDLLATRNAPRFEDLFQSAVELGDARIYACSMAMDLVGLEDHDLAEHMAGTMGLTAFLAEAEAGQLLAF